MAQLSDLSWSPGDREAAHLSLSPGKEAKELNRLVRGRYVMDSTHIFLTFDFMLEDS